MALCNKRVACLVVGGISFSAIAHFQVMTEHVDVKTHTCIHLHTKTHTHTRACMQEQDFLIDFMRRMHETHSCLEVMTKMEKWINEHRKDPQRSRLKRLVPQLGQFFTPLLLVDAFHVGPCKDVFLVCLCVCVCECVFAQLFVAQLH